MERNNATDLVSLVKQITGIYLNWKNYNGFTVKYLCFLQGCTSSVKPVQAWIRTSLPMNNSWQILKKRNGSHLSVTKHC